MLKNNSFKIVFILFLVALLVLVRAFEMEMFYDPFIVYFKSEFSQLPYPKYDSIKLYLNFILRYSINGVISLSIIYVIFRDASIVIFSSFMFMFFLFLLIFLMFLLLTYFDENQKMNLFYVRRFLIQPIFLLLFLPALYYQKVIAKK
jgi:exosortase F-associated protein